MRVVILFVVLLFNGSILIQSWTGGSVLIATESVGVVVCPLSAPCHTEANQPLINMIKLQG